jgi:hypothetical protein
MSLKAIENIMGGYSPSTERRKETEKLITKWEATGLLEGLDREDKVHNMAQLLENQAKQLIDETSRVGGPGTEEWSGVALPLVRRIFGELAAQDFVSVQPMNLPSGLIFYLDFKYGTVQNGNHAIGSDIHGNTSGSGDASGGLYGAGKYGYSINDQSSDTSTIGSAAANNTHATSSATWKDVEFEPALSASIAAGTIVKLTFDITNDFTNPDLEGIRAFAPVGVANATSITAFYPAYTSLNADESEINFLATGNFDAANTLTVKYGAAPTDITRGDFEQTGFATPAPNTSDDVDIPEIDIQLRSISIVAKTRKLKAIWTPELAQDLNAYHSVDAEAELTSMLSEYISMEIDLEILDMLKLNASAKTEYWSAKVGYEYDGSGTGESAFSQVSGASNAYTKQTWFQTLGNKLQAVSNAIHQKTLRGGANFMVISPETATVIESIPGYSADTDGDSAKNSYAMGVQKVGALNNRYTVYKNPYMLENDILLGFRGSNFLETGAVYAPYVPLIMTPLVYDPVNFTPRKGVMTRYAKKMVRPEFYGKVIVTDIDKV